MTRRALLLLVGLCLAGGTAAQEMTIDQGTKLIDVALMMTVLRLTKGELDDDRDH